jgi:urease accessory protein
MKKLPLFAAVLICTATPAWAHHPLAGRPMSGFADGLLSGVGHPLLGFDHLFFVALIGIAALFTGYRRAAPMAYIAAMLGGCLIVALGGAMPLQEAAIALSLLVIGGFVFAGRGLAVWPATLLFAGFGLFHGAAFGGVIAGQEAAGGLPVLAGYLTGLGATQYALALTVGWIARRLLGAPDAKAVELRLAGAAAAGVGLYLSLEQAEAAVFQFLGWSA